MTETRDKTYLEMAYGLARKAKGWSSPNPHVGSVIVKNRAIIGSGYHQGPGKPHAEILALRQSTISPRNSTIYLTLEPCTHWGRTPPCIDVLLQAKPKRVVVSDYDPNPAVFQKGVHALREAGIDVSVGLLKEKNRSLNETYFKYITRRIPFVTLKAAISLDGKMATRTHSSRWISSHKTRQYSHLLRGEHDAILIGVQTLIKDDPELTVRHPGWKGKKLLRIILDSRLRIPLTSKILKTLPQGKILVFTHVAATSPKALLLKKKGVEVITFPGPGRRIDLKHLLVWLGGHEVSSLLVEGGGQIHTSFIEKKLADKIFLSISPLFIGGEKAPALLRGQGIKTIEESLRLSKIRSLRLEDDTMIEGYF